MILFGQKRKLKNMNFIKIEIYYLKQNNSEFTTIKTIHKNIAVEIIHFVNI